MSEKVNKIEEQELKTVKEQTGKIQQCVLDLGSLEVKKAEIMQAYSEFLKELDVTLTNCIMGLCGFFFLFITSYIFEGDTLNNLLNINFKSWLLISHSAIFVSIAAHMSMFYLYKIYPVNKVFPFYALFPIFGIFQTMVIFNEIPTLIVFLGGLIVITSIYLLNKID